MREFTFRRYFWLTLSILLGPIPAFAGDHNGGSTDELSNVFALFSTKTTVRSASNMDESVARAPSSVTVFTHDDIRNLGVRNLQELLNYAPGFQSLRSVDEGDDLIITARGRSTETCDSVLIVVDGQRLNDLYSGGACILNHELFVDNIKRVEIIRGPGSAIYGSNAFFGLINIITLDDQSFVQGDAGIYNARAVALNLGTHVKDVAVWGSARLSSDQGFYYPNLVDIWGNEGAQSDAGMRADITANLSYEGFTANFRHMRRQYGGFLDVGELQNDTNNEDYEQSSLRLSYRRELSAAINFDVYASYLTQRWTDITQSAPAGVELFPGFTLTRPWIAGYYIYEEHWNFGGNFFWKIAPSNILMAGVQVLRSELTRADSIGNVDIFTNTELPAPQLGPSFNAVDTPRQVEGFYVQDRADLTPELQLTVGLRLDIYSDFGNALSPRASLTYATPWAAFIKAMYGHAFRAPNYVELHDQLVPWDSGNPKLGAETVDTYELAYIQPLGDWMEFTLTYFLDQARNLIVPGASPSLAPNNPFGATSYANTGSFNPQGLEFSTTIKPPVTDLVLSGTFTRLFAERLVVPDTFASIALNERIFNFNINLSGIVRSASASVPGQSAYGIVNGRIAYDVLPNVSVYINLRNAFDKSYRTYTHVLSNGVPNAQRALFAGALVTL